MGSSAALGRGRGSEGAWGHPLARLRLPSLRAGRSLFSPSELDFFQHQHHLTTTRTPRPSPAPAVGPAPQTALSFSYCTSFFHRSDEVLSPKHTSTLPSSELAERMVSVPTWAGPVVWIDLGYAPWTAVFKRKESGRPSSEYPLPQRRRAPRNI